MTMNEKNPVGMDGIAFVEFAAPTEGGLNHLGKLFAALGSKGMIISPSAGVYKIAPGYNPAQVLNFAKTFTSGYGNLPGNYLPGTLDAIQGY